MSDEQGADYPQDEPLPQDAVLLRGGPLDFDQLRRSASQPYKRKHGFYGISLYAFPGVSDAEEIFARSPLRYPEVCVVTAGEVREAGFEVKRTFEKRGHCSLIFPSEPSDEDVHTAIRLLEPCWTLGGE